MLKHYYNGTILTNAVLLGDETGFSAHATVGVADTCTIYVDDPEATYDFVAYKSWKIVEDECPSGNQVVWHGYVGDQGITRVAGAGKYQTGVERRWRIELIEDNGWPSRQIIIAASADRPEETVSDRIAWVLTMRGMTGIIYDHGLVEACTTLMDPEDYRNRASKAVLDDCALLSSYNWHVRYREASDDIELIFQAPLSTADPAILSISNVAADIDETTTWAPNDEAEQKFGASRIASGILLAYAGGTDYDQDPATAVTFGTVDQTAPTSAVKTKAKARAQITRLLAQHNEHDMSVEGLRLQLPAAKLNDVKHGQLISSVRLSHGRGDITTGIPMRVKSRAFGRPANLSQAAYDVDLSLSPVPVTPGIVQMVAGTFTISGTVTFPAPVTAGNLLVVSIAARSGGTTEITTDMTSLFVDNAVGRSIGFTGFGAPTYVDDGNPSVGGPDGAGIGYVTAVGDEQTVYFGQGGDIIIYEVFGATAVGAELKALTAQSASGTKSLGAWSVPGVIQFARFVVDTNDDAHAASVAGTGWTIDQQVFDPFWYGGWPHPQAPGMHSTSGDIPLVTGDSLPWGGVAVALLAA